MKYRCGHSGCDLCGARHCDTYPNLEHVGTFHVCNRCIVSAVKFSYEAMCVFGGTCIDPAKPCGNEKRRKQLEETEKEDKYGHRA